MAAKKYKIKTTRECLESCLEQNELEKSVDKKMDHANNSR